MASTSLTALREGLAANLSTIPAVQVSPYLLSNPTPPSIHVLPAGVTYHRAMHNGLEVVTFTVQAFIGTVTDIGAQKRLDELIASTGVSSVKAAAEADRTLGGAAADLAVTEMTGYQIYQLARGETVGADWTVQVYTT